MPTRLCAEARCGSPATYRGRCPEHARTNNQRTHSNTAYRRVYNSKRWALLRRRVLFEQPICAGCDNALAVDVDHIQSLDTGGAPFDRANVQGLCKQCHSVKTRQEQMGTTQAPSKPPFLIICGEPGTGKTTISAHLAAITGAHTFGPDDYNGDWDSVLNRLDTTNNAIVECCRIPRALRRKTQYRDATIVQLTAPSETKHQRLTDRGETPAAIERLLTADGLGIGYEDHIEPDIILSTATATATATPQDTARTIVDRLKG